MSRSTPPLPTEQLTVVPSRWRFTRAVGPTESLQPPVYDGDVMEAVRSRELLTRRVLAAADMVGATLAVAATYAWAAGTVAGAELLLAAPLIVAILKVAGLYDRDDLVLRRSTLDEVPLLLQLSSVFTLLVALAGEPLLSTRLGPQHLVPLWLVTTAVLTASRSLGRALVRRVAADERCLVVGDPQLLRQLRRTFDGRRAPATVVAAIEVHGADDHPISEVADMRALIDRHDAHRVVIAPTAHSSNTVDLIRIAKAAGARVSVLPRALEAVGSAVVFEEVDGLTMMGVRRFGLSRSSLAIKRAFDLLVGSCCLLVCAPLLGVLAVAVRLDTPGPVFFRQTRIGRDGRPFKMWKFRSMVLDAEAHRHSLIALNEAGNGMFKLSCDPRVTRVGRFLRRTSLDELPQILNVLRGEMSLVGPRPLVADEDALIEGLFRSRLHLTPGMTGSWQILGTTRVPMEEMIAMDYLYVANWSLWSDVKILLRTVPHMLGRRGV